MYTSSDLNKDIDQYGQTASNQLNQYKDAATQNTGLTGFNAAVNQARGLSQQNAANSTASATNQAIQAAQQAGSSKAAAAMNAANTAANTYQNAYNSAYANNLSMAQQYQQSAMQAADTVFNQNMQAAQTKMQMSLAKYQQSVARTQQIIQTALKVGGALKSVGGAMRQKGASGALMDSTFASQNALNNRNLGAIPTLGMPADVSNVANNQWLTNFPSDERLKEKSKVDAFIDTLSAVKYKYTPEAQDEVGADNEDHVGILAQDAEKTRPDMIDEENGYKAIDFQKLLETTTAGLAALREELGLSNKEKEN